MGPVIFGNYCSTYKCAAYYQNVSRNFLALVKDGSLEPYLKKEEVEKNESNQEEEVKKGDVKEEL